MEKRKSLERSAQLMARTQTYCWRPYTQAATAAPPLPVVGAKGAELLLGDGTTIIDGISSWWVTLHGHGHPYINEKIAQQLSTLDHVMFADMTHEGASALAERLAELLPGRPQRLFFSDNGSTAVETALKIALQYWRNVEASSQRRTLIAFEGAFHGETFAAMALSSPDFFSAPFAPFLFKVERIPPPTAGRERASVDALKAILGKGTAACFIFEPFVQGVAGMLPHCTATLSELVSLCRSYGVLTIADEVMTGCGRLGPYFACELLGQAPDMLCLAKALTGGVLPLAVTACSETIYEAFLSADRRQALLHGHSYCANPLGCAAALASLELLYGAECREQRQSIERCHSRIATRWRQRSGVHRCTVAGTLLAVELADSGLIPGYYHRLAGRLGQFYLDRGVHLRPLGNTVYLLPPYCITERQLAHAYAAIEESLDLVEQGAL